MVAWRRDHPQATFDEIAGQLQKERKKLMGHLLGELAVQEVEKEQWQEQVCPECGGKLENKGVRKKRVVHSEGEAELERPYYHCPSCGRGFFSLG
jgi:YgiT-type zinc finger domain-containing protein